MRKPKDKAGFTPPTSRPLGYERRTVAVAELVASLALALSTIVAATAVSIGIARADAIGKVVGQEPSIFGAALLMGLVFVVMAASPPRAGAAKTPHRD
jgi:hypothetical protein